MLFEKNIPYEIITHILKISNIKCYTCHKQFRIKDNKFFLHNTFKQYFCSKECYNFI